MQGTSSSNWVVDMKEELEHIEQGVEMARWSKPSIYRVPEWLKMNNSEAYQPRLVSLGPFHHGESKLLPMEEHKRRAVLHIVKRSRKPIEKFVTSIEEVADELMDAYHNLEDEWRTEPQRSHFVKMMVLDGCFLLELMKGIKDKQAPRDYAYNDPVFSAHGMLYLWPGIRSDMLVIENQLPLFALYRLEEIWRGTTPLSEKDINELVLQFMWDPLKQSIGNNTLCGLCLHPLDVFHKTFCGLHPAPETGSVDWERSTHCAVELKEAGIHFKKCDKPVIDFKNGVLSLPTISIHDGSEKVFLNLMAFERLHGSCRSEATAYFIFMDNLINSESDVALLRSKGIIKNLVSSDKVATRLFNILSKEAVLSPYSRLHDVRREVNKYCERTPNRWMAFFRHTYLSNPWVIISLVAAVILVVANLLQTFYTIVAVYKMT